MVKVLCLDNGNEFHFVATNGYDAISKMLYTLNLNNLDRHASINLCNGRTWELVHNGNTYACLF